MKLHNDGKRYRWCQKCGWVRTKTETCEACGGPVNTGRVTREGHLTREAKEPEKK